eukprot:6210136-Pleurochrysis_carterae.AAC.1
MSPRYRRVALYRRSRQTDDFRFMHSVQYIIQPAMIWSLSIGPTVAQLPAAETDTRSYLPEMSDRNFDALAFVIHECDKVSQEGISPTWQRPSRRPHQVGLAS